MYRSDKKKEFKFKCKKCKKPKKSGKLILILEFSIFNLDTSTPNENFIRTTLRGDGIKPFKPTPSTKNYPQSPLSKCQKLYDSSPRSSSITPLSQMKTSVSVSHVNLNLEHCTIFKILIYLFRILSKFAKNHSKVYFLEKHEHKFTTISPPDARHYIQQTKSEQ